MLLPSVKTWQIYNRLVQAFLLCVLVAAVCFTEWWLPSAKSSIRVSREEDPSTFLFEQEFPLPESADLLKSRMNWTHVESVHEWDQLVRANYEVLFASVGGNRTSVAAKLKEEFLDRIAIQKRFSRKDIVCDLKKVGNLVLSRTSKTYPPLDEAIKRILPPRDLLDGRNFRNCAIVSNSGAIRNSHSGKAIDSHTLVVRLNSAPIVGFEEDVGRRHADLRIVNNAVVNAKKWDHEDVHRHLKLLDFPTFSLVASSNWKQADRDLIVWDHCCCGVRHYEFCLENFGMDGTLQRDDLDVKGSKDGLGYFLARRAPEVDDQKLFMLSFNAPWDTLMVMQKCSPAGIGSHTPSTGFLAIALLMNICDEVSAFEFVPSIRNVKGRSICHYSDTFTVDKVGLPRRAKTKLKSRFKRSYNDSIPLKLCDNLGKARWHPVDAEKSLLYQLNTADDEEVFLDGVIRIPGFSQFKCDESP